MKGLWMAAAVVAAAWAVSASAAEYARRPAALHAKPSASSPKVGQLATGARVTVLKKKGSWRKVKVGAMEGWVHRSRLTRRKPSRDVIAETKALNTGDVRVVRVETTASVRGLTPSAKAYAAAKGISADAQNSVDRLTAFHVAPSELDAFMKEGKLGVYSEGGE